MFIVDLACEGGHHFEGWYDDAAEYRALAARGEVTCPLCQSAEVTRMPSPTRISTATSRGEKRERATAGPSPDAPITAPPAPPPQAAPAAPAPRPALPLPVQQALSRVWRDVRRTHEDAGEAFAERALRMFRGEEEARPIFGQATSVEEARLEEEGVPYVKLPIPDIDQN